VQHTTDTRQQTPRNRRQTTGATGLSVSCGKRKVVGGGARAHTHTHTAHAPACRHAHTRTQARARRHAHTHACTHLQQPRDVVARARRALLLLAELFCYSDQLSLGSLGLSRDMVHAVFERRDLVLGGCERAGLPPLHCDRCEARRVPDIK
jgi:hypothetical protein